MLNSPPTLRTLKHLQNWCCLKVAHRCNVCAEPLAIHGALVPGCQPCSCSRLCCGPCRAPGQPQHGWRFQRVSTALGDLRGLCALIKGVIRVLFLSDQDLAESRCCVCAWDHLNEFLPISKGLRFPARGGLGACWPQSWRLLWFWCKRGNLPRGFVF